LWAEPAWTGSTVPHLVLRVLGEAAKLSELQLDAGHLGHGAVRGPAGRVGGAPPDVHVRVRDPGGSVEGRHQPGADVFLWRTNADVDLLVSI